MSSPSRTNTRLVPLPEGKEVEIVLVKLADGRLVGRTREELEAAPSAPAPAAPR